MKITFATYDMDSGCVIARLATGDLILIDCDSIEAKYADNPYHRSELDYLIYNDPAAYVELITEGDPESYLQSAVDHHSLES
jgi:hypothetical protein